MNPTKVAGGLLPGNILLCKYPRVQRVRERILLRWLGGTKWTATDELGERLKLDISTLEEIWLLGEDRVLPPEVPRNRAVLQEDTDRIYTEADLRRLIDENKQWSDMEIVRLGVPEPPDLPFYKDSPEDLTVLGAWGPHRPLRIPGDHIVVVAEVFVEKGVSLGGTEVTMVGDEVGLGASGLKKIGDRVVKLAVIPMKDKEKFRKELHKDVWDPDTDPRVLKLMNLPGSAKRGRSFNDAAIACSEVAETEWPVEGPRTLRWVLDFMQRKGRDPRDHTVWWRTHAKLDEGAWGVSEHEDACDILHDALCWDQLDACNCASLERVARKIQTIEYHYRQRSDLKKIEAAGDGKLDFLTKELLSGKRGEAGTVCVSPDLVKYLQRETTDEVDKAKIERKLREERAAAAAAKKK